MNREIIIVSGPTGSGKSKLGLELAQTFNGEIISADSVAVYKYFDVGSAKPTKAELDLVKHHLVSELEPEAEFSAGEFSRIAQERIEQILSNGKVPIVVGGTGLYIRALLNGLIKDKREELLEEVSWEDLNNLDQLSASSINPNDRARIKRAYEHFKRSGRSISEVRSSEAHQPLKANALIVLASPEREKLYDAINLRSAQMLDSGLVEETKQLISKYPETIKPLGSIGYLHARRFIAGGYLSKGAFLEDLAQDTRRFAKRQLTWWRNQPKSLGWTELEETPILADITSAVRAFLEPKENLGHTREIIRYSPR